MLKNILEVEGKGTRKVRKYAYGSFHSAHKQEDVQKWLEHKNVGEYTTYFEDIFGEEWCEDYAEDYIEDFEVDFNDSEGDMTEDDCDFDEEIQEFLDEEPKRERDTRVRNIVVQDKIS